MRVTIGVALFHGLIVNNMDQKPTVSNNWPSRFARWFVAVRQRAAVAACLGFLGALVLVVTPYWNSIVYSAGSPRGESAWRTVQNDNWADASQRALFGGVVTFAIGLCDLSVERHRSFRLTRS
jgi:hypothetical protein